MMALASFRSGHFPPLKSPQTESVQCSAVQCSAIMQCNALKPFFFVSPAREEEEGEVAVEAEADQVPPEEVRVRGAHRQEDAQGRGLVCVLVC